MRCSRRVAFTLIEVLIVVVIMSILAAVILPQISTSTNDAKESQLKHHLHMMRNQIELYRTQHLGEYPSNIKLKMIATTNLAGAIGPVTPSTEYPFGPYMSAIPAQPFSGSITITNLAAGAQPSFTAAPGGGWIYQASTGQLWVNHADYSTW